MIVIAPTVAEKQNGKLSPENLELANKALKEDGFVVLENVVDLDHIQVLKDRALADVELLLARPDRPFNWNSGNVQQNPAPFAPYLFRDVLVNDLVIDVTESILGKGMYCNFYSGNTAVKSTERQPVHADIGHLWQNMDPATPAYAFVVNVPLVDFRAENGSTEIWPGTHLDTSISVQDGFIELSDEKLAARRIVVPPFQPVVSRGSVLVRDIRMWHAGMPNTTDEPRPMIAMIHNVGWWPGSPIPFAKGSEPFLEHPRLSWRVDYVDGIVDHIAMPGSYGYVEPKEEVKA